MILEQNIIECDRLSTPLGHCPFLLVLFDLFFSIRFFRHTKQSKCEAITQNTKYSILWRYDLDGNVIISKFCFLSLALLSHRTSFTSQYNTTCSEGAFFLSLLTSTMPITHTQTPIEK